MRGRGEGDVGNKNCRMTLKGMDIGNWGNCRGSGNIFISEERTVEESRESRGEEANETKIWEQMGDDEGKEGEEG